MVKLSFSVFLILVVCACAHAQPRAVGADKIEVQGHRGARWSRPENTLPAFQFALENGADAVELDMHVTKDDQVVVSHDHFLNPKLCVDQNGARIRGDILIRSLTLSELQKYDCGSLQNPDFPEQQPVAKTPIPTLEAVFELIEKSPLPAAKILQFNIETKSEEKHPEYTPEPERFVELVLALLKKHGLMSRVILESFDYRTLKIAHRLEPSLRLSVLIHRRPRGGLVPLMKEIEAQTVSPEYSWLNANDVAELHSAGCKVLPWTPNAPDDWHRLIEIGVDGIITDNPRGLREFLAGSAKN